jgi:hypothetical protein
MRKAAGLYNTIFWVVLSVTLTVWVLRGLGILTFIPGAVIWLLILLTVGTAIFALIQNTRR